MLSGNHWRGQAVLHADICCTTMPGCLLQVSVNKKAAAEQIKGLYRLFEAKDCTMVEVSCGCHSCGPL